jgi:hypothetical protein
MQLVRNIHEEGELHMSEQADRQDQKPSVTLPGTVEKIIPPIAPAEPEKAQIAVEGADELYKEIRIENVLEDKDGAPVALKHGVEVQVTIAADKKATTPKESPKS